MAACAFPNCNRNAEKNGFCIGHRHFVNDGELKKQTVYDKVEPKKKSLADPDKKAKSYKVKSASIKK